MRVSSKTKLNKMILSRYLYTLLDALLASNSITQQSQQKNKGQRGFPLSLIIECTLHVYLKDMKITLRRLKNTFSGALNCGATYLPHLRLYRLPIHYVQSPSCKSAASCPCNSGIETPAFSKQMSAGPLSGDTCSVTCSASSISNA